MTDPTPAPATHRIDSLDVLRGFALLGILVMNVQSFSMPIGAYFNPTVWGSLHGFDGAVWFMTLFSILFGAGYEQTMEAFQKNFPAWVEKQPRPGRGAKGSS
jgi:uncharacterized protein